MTINPSSRELEIQANIKEVHENIKAAAQKANRNPEEIKVMAVTKTVAPEDVNAAIAGGISLLGENRAQELLQKYDQYVLKEDHIHFIGHLQTNKVKSIIDKVSMIESVDSVKVAGVIDKCAGNIGKNIDVLLEINIGGQSTKNGISMQDIYTILGEVSVYRNIKVRGLMAIPPPENAERHFRAMKEVFDDIKKKDIKNVQMDYLSMGMSGDYETAVLYGANIVRIGTGLFGRRR